MKILMKPSWLMEPRYCTMFLCRRRLCKAISSCKGCEYLRGGTPGWGAAQGPLGPSRTPRHGTYQLSRSGISLIAMRTWLLRQRPA